MSFASATGTGAGQLQDEVAATLAIAWVQAALDAALTKKGPEARVTVLTHAPDMLPVIR